jgi:hypothetical protein
VVYAVTGILLLIGKKTRAAAAWLGLTVLFVELVVYVPIGVVERASLNNGLNYVMDTLMFCGTVLLLARAMPREAEQPNYDRRLGDPAGLTRIRARAYGSGPRRRACDRRRSSQASAITMPWWDILASLTTNPAAFFKATSKGRVEKGMAADLVILGADPAGDVRNFAKVACTIREAKVIYRR